MDPNSWQSSCLGHFSAETTDMSYYTKNDPKYNTEILRDIRASVVPAQWDRLNTSYLKHLLGQWHQWAMHPTDSSTWTLGPQLSEEVTESIRGTALLEKYGPGSWLWVFRTSAHSVFEVWLRMCPPRCPLWLPVANPPQLLWALIPWNCKARPTLP